MSRVLESVCPARLGKSFRWLLASSWISNIGDGIALAAGPLLVASQTDDPLLVAMAALLQRVPWLLFGLYAGVVADRHDRRLVVVLADSTRAVLLVLLSLSIMTGVVNVGVVLVSMFLLGTAEAFADVTTNTLMPMIVEPDDLGVGNARLMFGQITANQLAGPPIGALLFAVAMAVPFVTQAVFVGLGAVLMARIVAPKPTRHDSEASIRRQITDGLQWLWRHPAVRTLTITIVTFNVTFGAAWSVLVLYARDHLGLSDLGFGLLTTMSAIGGVVGSWSYGWIERRVSLADLMRAGLIIETLTHLALALTTTAWVAFVIFFVFGIHIAVWGTTATSIRHRAVPTEFQGRVGSVYMVGVHGGIVVGAAIGGLIARRWGLTAPFWFAFVGSALILAAIWSSLRHIAHIDTDSRGDGGDGRRPPDAVFADPRLAQVYDPLDPDRSDLEVYRAMAHEFGARSVLDVGCGTGTFACMLALDGIAVTGVDPALASLEVARTKPGADAVRWLHGDATTLPPLVVDAAFMTANVAQVFLTDEEWTATLLGIRRALDPHGVLVFETRDPARRAWEEWTPERTHTEVDVSGIGVVASWEEVTSVEGSLVTFRSMTAFRHDDAVIESVSTLRFRSRDEIERSLVTTGFAVVDVRDAPDRPGREFVFVCRPVADQGS